MDIKEEDVVSENDVAIKTEIKSEVLFPSRCSQNEEECFSNPLAMHIHSETINNWKTEAEQHTLVSHKRDFLPENPVIKLDKYKSDNEMNNKIEVKVEPWWIKTETSSVCDNIKDGDFSSVKCSRLCTEADFGASSGKAPLTFAEVSGRDTNFYNLMHHYECESQDSDVIETEAVKHVYSVQSGKCSDGGALYFKQKNFSDKSETPQQCNISESFTDMSHLKSHELIHSDKRLHICNTCDKNFARSSNLRRHNWIHEGKMPYHCKTCDKSFTQLSHLKRHKLIHEGKIPYHCKTCDKSFTQLSHLKRHTMIHERKMPYQCKTCEKSFTQMSHLKRHKLIHEGKKPHQCKTCDKSFNQLSNLKIHNLIHEGRKKHKCEICDKNFTRLSDLKIHNLIHDGLRPHKCKTCDKSFVQFSHLKRHKLTHEGKKPHKCQTCYKSFTRLSDLKRHNLTHYSK